VLFFPDIKAWRGPGLQREFLDDCDEELWRRVQHNDATAFDMLRKRHALIVRKALCSGRRDLHPEDLDALENEVWLGVWVGRERFRGESIVTSWIFSIARNMALGSLRPELARRRALERMTRETKLTEGPNENVVVDDITIRQCMEKLSPDEKDLIRLGCYEQLTDVEIAAKLNMPLGTMKSRIRRAKQKIRECVQGDEGESES
jgi:RNA polymerase sigma-70 factor (ECF subfamily)